MSLKQLREDRAKLGAEIQQMDARFQAESGKWDEAAHQEYAKAFNAKCSEAEAINARIASAERAAQFGVAPAPVARVPVTPPIEQREPDNRLSATGDGVVIDGRQYDYNTAFKAWVGARHGIAPRDCDPQGAVQAALALGLSGAGEVAIQLSRDPKRLVARGGDGVTIGAANLSTSTSSPYAGYTIPQGFVYKLEESLLAFGNVRQHATVMRTAQGNLMYYPTVNDTSNKGELIAEETDTTTVQNPAFGRVSLTAYKFSSRVVPITFELIQDSAFDLLSYIAQICGTRISRNQNDYFTTGTGSSQPQGYMVGGSSGVTAASATAYTADELIDLQHSLDPAYRAMPGVGWMMHDSILKSLKKIKDSAGRPIYLESYRQGEPGQLLGYPVWINQSMASALTTGLKPFAFGDFSKLLIRDAGEIRFMRYGPEAFITTDSIGFCAFMRTDSKVLDAGTDPIRYMTLA